VFPFAGEQIDDGDRFQFIRVSHPESGFQRHGSPRAGEELDHYVREESAKSHLDVIARWMIRAYMISRAKHLSIARRRFCGNAAI
jgi:hypothetical protein